MAFKADASENTVNAQNGYFRFVVIRTAGPNLSCGGQMAVTETATEYQLAPLHLQREDLNCEWQFTLDGAAEANGANAIEVSVKRLDLMSMDEKKNLCLQEYLMVTDNEICSRLLSDLRWRRPTRADAASPVRHNEPHDVQIHSQERARRVPFGEYHLATCGTNHGQGRER